MSAKREGVDLLSENVGGKVGISDASDAVKPGQWTQKSEISGHVRKIEDVIFRLPFFQIINQCYYSLFLLLSRVCTCL